MKNAAVKTKVYGLVISLFISTATAYFTSAGQQQVTLATRITLGMVVFCSLQLLQLLWVSLNVYTVQRDERYLRRELSEIAPVFTSIGSCYESVLKDSHGERDLFVTYLRKEIRVLHARLKEAAEQQSIRVASDYILNVEGVFDAFNVSPHKILKITWPIATDKRLFESLPETRFFEVMCNMLQKHVLTEVRVLVIPHDQAALECEQSKKLFGFFKTQKHFEAKYCIKQVFQSACASNGVPANSLDFGIYGPRMLFVTETVEPQHEGTYTKDRERVALYAALFDQLWNSENITHDNPAERSSRIDYKDIKEL